MIAFCFGFSLMCSWFIHVTTCFDSFLLPNNIVYIYSHIHTYYILYIHLPFDGYLGYFQFLAIIQLWTFVSRFCMVLCFLSFKNIELGPKFLGYVVTLHLTFQDLLDCFPASCIILHVHQRELRVPISLHPHQHLLLSVSLIIIIQVGMRWYFIGFIFISPDGYHCWIYFHVLVGHLCIFFGEMVRSDALPMFNFSHFLLLSCKVLYVF